jgi:hypothetical protein
MAKYSELEQFFKEKNEKKYFIEEKIKLFREGFAKFINCHVEMVNVADILFNGDFFSFNLVISIFVKLPQTEQIEETLLRTIKGEYNKRVVFFFKDVEYSINDVDDIFKIYLAIYNDLFRY